MSYEISRTINGNYKRRKFLKLSSKTLMAAGISSPFISCSTVSNEKLTMSKDITIQQAIDIIMSQIPGVTDKATVDTVKIGDVSQVVTGIVSTFMATIEVIEKSVEMGANFIITHEPTFYNHLDQTDWLAEDKVYQYKRALLEKHNIVVWRFHDFWHQYRPDGILTGFLQELGWTNYLDENLENTVAIPSQTLVSLASDIKTKFNLTRTFYIGNPNKQCSRVGILPGAWGGRAHIPFLGKDIDTLIVGESAEWEAVEYIRDASHAGMDKALIIMGHAESEDPGMRYLAEWLVPLLPGVAIHHISAGDPFVPV